MSVVVVTDASAAISRDLLHELDIRILPLHILSGDDEFIDDCTTDPQAHFIGEGVTTSGPSVQEVREVLEAALRDSGGAGVVVITMSSGLSSTHSTTLSQAAQIDPSITVIDSQSIDMALGFAVIDAAASASAGGTAAQVADAARSVLASADALYCVATLDHLRAGGRVSALTALVGGALRIVPVLRLVDGRIVSARKARTVGRAREQLVQLAAQVLGDQPTRVAVHHVAAPDVAEAVRVDVRREFATVADLVVGPCSSTVAAHLGPGAVGISVAPVIHS